MPFWILIVGILMMALTVAVHALGAAFWLDYVASLRPKLRQEGGVWPLFRAVIMTAVVLLLLHCIEMILWALFFIALPENGGLASLSEAIYFSMITFTTLGYGDITLNEPWRALSGLEAMVGIAVFGLTTAILFAVVQRVWKIQHDHSPESPTV